MSAFSASETPGVPFLDLVSPHVELERELTEVFLNTLHSADFVGGPMVETFESAFAVFCKARYSVAVSSGTDALRFAIMACGIKPGDSVLTVPHTFIATTEAISQAGALPEFVDIDESTYNMSAELLRHYLQNQCKRSGSGRVVSLRTGRSIAAIIPVHLYGQMADMDAIIDIAEEYGLVVIEDACQAHGAKYFSKKLGHWVTAGSVGKAAAFSFYPGKNLGACGEAGAVTTNDESVAEAVRLIRNHGQSTKYYHDVEGYNGRLDAIQAGLLHAKLGHLRSWNEQRRERASEYRHLLADIDTVILPHEPAWSRAVYHLYVIRIDNRDSLIAHMKTAGIGTGIHYPLPLHVQQAYVALNYSPEDFPVAMKIAREIVSLPMYPQLTTKQQMRVVAEIRTFLAESIGEFERKNSTTLSAAN
jgi:dTDP-4-amino-4,6-dideoxygalactose transaminase